MKLLNHILVLSLIMVLYLSCSTAPEFERENENDPDSKLFIPDSPSIDGVTFEIDSLKNIIFTWSPEQFLDGFIIKKRYDTQSSFKELINVVSRDSIFIDSSKIFTEGTTYQLNFFREVGESQRVLTKDPLEITLNFEPFSKIGFSYNENTGQLYISSTYSNSNDNATLRYFDGIDVEINKSSIIENWEPFETYELDDISVNQDFTSFEIIRTKNIPVFDLKLRISQFIYDSTNTKKYLKSITHTKFIHTPDDVNFEFTDELNGTLTWRNSIFSFGGVILSGSVNDTLDYPTSRVDIHFDPSPTPPIQISVQLFTGENYSEKNQSYSRYPDVGTPYIEGFSTVDNQSFEFSWNTLFYEDYAGFIIEQSILPSTTYTAIDTVDKNTTSYIVNDLDQSKKYNFKVHSYTSEWSPSVTVGYQNTFVTLESDLLETPGWNLTFSKNGKFLAKHLSNEESIFIKNVDTADDYTVEMSVYTYTRNPKIIDFVVSEKNNTVIFIGDNHSVDNAGDYISVYDFINDEYVFEYVDTPFSGTGKLKLLSNDSDVAFAINTPDDLVNLYVYDTMNNQILRTLSSFTFDDEWIINSLHDRAILCSNEGIFEYDLLNSEITNQLDDSCFLGQISDGSNKFVYRSTNSIKILDLQSFAIQESILTLSTNELNQLRNLWYYEEDALLIYRKAFGTYSIYNVLKKTEFLFSLPSYTENQGANIQKLTKNLDGTYSLISSDAEFTLELKEGWSIIEKEAR